MKERGLDCLIIPHNAGDWDNFQPDTRYLTCLGGGRGWRPPRCFRCRANRSPRCASPGGVKTLAGVRIGSPTSDLRPTSGGPDSSAQALKELGAESGRVGIVGVSDVLREPEGSVPYGELTALREAMPRVRFEPATDLSFYHVRKRKSAEEIALVEQAQTCADAIRRRVSVDRTRRRRRAPDLCRHSHSYSARAADCRP